MSQEFDSLEDAIEEAEEEAEKRRGELAEAEAKGLGFSELADLYKAIEAAEADVETKTDRWVVSERRVGRSRRPTRTPQPPPHPPNAGFLSWPKRRS